MLESLIGKVNMKRLILSVIAMFVFIFASDFVIHSLILGKTYKELAHLWRQEERRTIAPTRQIAGFVESANTVSLHSQVAGTAGEAFQFTPDEGTRCCLHTRK